jgi:DNA primase catalytic core
MIISNLNEVIDALRPKLPDYLKSQKINPDKKFKCINPNHDDDTPSARVNTKEDSEYAKCFGCGQSYDIFTAASYLENLPTEGADWIQDNVLVLANRFDIDVSIGELSEREKYTAAVTRAYTEASRYISSLETGEWTEDLEKYIEGRGWTKQALSEMGIGVGSREGLVDHMLQTGYSAEYLREINLVTDEAQVIEEGRLIFTMADRAGKPVGFIARSFGKGPKYINTTSAGLQYSLPNKGETLYGIHWAKKHAKKKPLYLFEGNGDVITARLNHLENCAAVQGSNLSEAQLQLIKKLGFKNIILAMDFDDAGLKATEKILTELPGIKDLYISVLSGPDGVKSDPGEYIEKHGLEEFMKLPVISAFSWLLKRKIETGTVGVDLGTQLVPVIAAEPNAITREIYIKELSNASDVSVHALEIEVTKILDDAAYQLDIEERGLIERAWSQMNQFPDERVSILSRAVRHMEELKDRYTAGKFSSSSCVALLDEVKRQGDEADPDAVVGFKLPLLPELADCFAGGKDWATDTLMMLGGPENSGKSSLMCFKSINIAADNDNDALALYFSIDDSAGDILPKFVTGANCLIQDRICTTPDDELLLGAVINPMNWTRLKKLTNAQHNALVKRRSDAFDMVRSLMLNERLVLKDRSDGSNLDYLESSVRYYRDRYPSKRIFAVLDNTHNLSDYESSAENIRDRYTRICNRLKAIATRYHICLMTSVEYRKATSGIKMGNKILPSNDDIAEARAFKYRANWIGHIYNDMHTKPEEYDTFHVHPATAAHLPRILLLHGKTKINSFKGMSVLDFFPGQSAFRWVEETQAKIEAQRFIEARKEAQDGDDNEDW